jgi:hypothetical protein
VGDPKARGACAGEFKLLPVALTVIERNEMDQALLDRDLVRQGNGIEPAGADDERVHEEAPCFDRVGCDRVGPRPTICSPSSEAV